MLNIHLVVGARPNFMKMAPLYDEFAKHSAKFRLKLVHTGQHYDESMSKLFFIDLKMPKPDIYLEVGSATHGVQTARIMERYEENLLKDKPDIVFVAGDVNSTAACALDAAKLHIPVAHVEAGLRSYDRRMPEELNRLITDQLADYLFTPSQDAGKNLLKEGIGEDKIHFVGNIMIDSLISHKVVAQRSGILEELRIKTLPQVEKYCLVTLHRPSNVDSKEGLQIILETLRQISQQIKVVFPVHPRTMHNIQRFGLEYLLYDMQNLIITEPLGYLAFIKLETNADFVITDSGGIQEETTYLQIPCLTLRENTERPITITEGTNQLVELDKDKILQAALEIIGGKRKTGKIPEFWDGKTSERIVKKFL